MKTLVEYIWSRTQNFKFRFWVSESNSIYVWLPSLLFCLSFFMWRLLLQRCTTTVLQFVVLIKLWTLESHFTCMSYLFGALLKQYIFVFPLKIWGAQCGLWRCCLIRQYWCWKPQSFTVQSWYEELLKPKGPVISGLVFVCFELNCNSQVYWCLHFDTYSFPNLNVSNHNLKNSFHF